LLVLSGIGIEGILELVDRTEVIFELTASDGPITSVGPVVLARRSIFDFRYVIAVDVLTLSTLASDRLPNGLSIPLNELILVLVSLAL
jgi:hypothetical protein